MALILAAAVSTPSRSPVIEMISLFDTGGGMLICKAARVYSVSTTAHESALSTVHSDRFTLMLNLEVSSLTSSLSGPRTHG